MLKHIHKLLQIFYNNKTKLILNLRQIIKNANNDIITLYYFKK